MAGDPGVINDILHDINPPNRLNIHCDRSTSIAAPSSKDEDEVERSGHMQTLFAWGLYGTQVAISTALFHPFSYARVLMELGFEPAPPKPSRTLFGKPCLVFPNVNAYIRAIKARDGRLGLWSGLGANFCSVLLCNSSNDLSYHLIDEFVKRKIRASPRKAWSVFVLADQENQPYSVVDFMEDLSKDVAARILSLSLSYPFQVLFVRTAAQFIWKERAYQGFLASFLQIYREEGFRGFYGGYVPYILGEIGALVVVWMATFLFRSAVTGDRLLLTVFRFATDYVARTLLYPLKLVSRVMSVNTSRLRAAVSSLPSFTSWVDCFKHLKAQNELMRGNNIFIRVVSNGRPGIFEKYGYAVDDSTGYPVQGMPPSVLNPKLPSEVMKPFINRAERHLGSSTFRTVF